MQACGNCGTGFEPKRSTARFCSARCRVAASRKLRVPDAPVTPPQGLLYYPCCKHCTHAAAIVGHGRRCLKCPAW